MVSRAATESAALAAAQASLADDNEDDDGDGEDTKRHHFKELIDLESAKAEKKNREVAETYFNWLEVKTKAQEIAKTRASYRRLLVVALGQLKRMRAVTVALPRGRCARSRKPFSPRRSRKSSTSKARPKSSKTWRMSEFSPTAPLTQPPSSAWSAGDGRWRRRTHPSLTRSCESFRTRPCT